MQQAHTLGFLAARVYAQAENLRAACVDFYLDRHGDDRLLLPVRRQHIFTTLPQLVGWILSTTSATGEIDEETKNTLAILGRDCRKSRIPVEHFPTLGEAAAHALEPILDGVPAGFITVAADTLREAARIAYEAAKTEEDEGLLAFTTATVVEVERRSRRITVVRAQLDDPWDWQAGQYFSVSSPRIQGLWRYLSPALPASPTGEIEFHLKAENPLSITGQLSHINPGEILYVSRAYGTTTLDVGDERAREMGMKNPQRDLLLVSHTTGLAPLKSIIIDLISRGNSNRRVHLFCGADYPGELYDLVALWHLAAFNPWLSITPVSTNENDEYWVKPTEHSRPPRGLHLTHYGDIGHIVASYGTWLDRDILVCGSPAAVAHIKQSLIDGGTPEDLIRHD